MQTSKLWLTLILSFGFLVLAMGTIRGGTGVDSYLKLKKSREVLRAATEDLARQNDNLNSEISKIEQSAGYAERILRDKYHQKDQGERIVFFPD